MLDTGIGTLYLFFVLSLMGLGPAFIISKKKIAAVAIAPIIGVTFITLVGTYLVFFDLPVISWAHTVLYVSVALSLSLLFWLKRKASNAPPSFHAGLKNTAEMPIFIGGFIIASLLLLLPMLIGGLTFTVFRGNGIDTFNYLSIAGLLQHEPYSWAKMATVSQLSAQNPTYPWAQELLNTRWSTSMLLAWCSTITSLPLYRLEHGFTVLFFLMTYSAGFSLARLLSFNACHALLIALTLSVGFWAQLVLDIRAMSQISVLPVLLLMVILMVQGFASIKSRFPFIVFTGVLATIQLLYIEIMPFVALGTVLFILLPKTAPLTSRTLIISAAALVLSWALIAPLLKNYLFAFFLNQMHAAVGDKNTWHLAYFHWLYARPLLNFWGNALWANTFAQHAVLAMFLKNFICGLSLILTLLFCYGIGHLLFVRQTPELKIIAAFFIAALLMFVYLCLCQQRWAAGKAMTYGYPFMILLLPITSFILLPRVQLSWMIIKGSQAAVIIWLLMQCGLGILRAVYAYHQRVYPHYILHHYDYLRHDWDISTLTDFLRKNRVQTLGLMLDNHFLRDYLDVNWGWQIHVTHLTHLGPQAPRYVIVANEYASLNHLTPVAVSHEFSLIDNKSIHHGII